jgi:hypothetical protein
MIKNREHMWLRDAAIELRDSYMRVYMLLERHPEIPRERVGRLIFVCLDDLREYEPAR